MSHQSTNGYITIPDESDIVSLAAHANELAEIDSALHGIDSDVTAISNALATHKASGDHDGRYFLKNQLAPYRMLWNSTVVTTPDAFSSANKMGWHVSHGGAIIVPQTQTGSWLFSIKVDVTTAGGITLKSPACEYPWAVFVNGSSIGSIVNASSPLTWTPGIGTGYQVDILISSDTDADRTSMNFLAEWIDGTNVIYSSTPE